MTSLLCLRTTRRNYLFKLANRLPTREVFYWRHMIKAADIIDLIYQTADHNVTKNKHLLESIPDAVKDLPLTSINGHHALLVMLD